MWLNAMQTASLIGVIASWRRYAGRAVLWSAVVSVGILSSIQGFHWTSTRGCVSAWKVFFFPVPLICMGLFSRMSPIFPAWVCTVIEVRESIGCTFTLGMLSMMPYHGRGRDVLPQSSLSTCVNQASIFCYSEMNVAFSWCYLGNIMNCFAFALRAECGRCTYVKP